MTRNVKLLIAAVAVLLGWAGYWLVQNFERVPVEVEADFQGKARYDRLLAARQLLDSFGSRVQVHYTRHDLPSSDGTLVLLGYHATPFGGEVKAVLDWVGSGGHLVMVAWPTGDNPLLESLGVRGVVRVPDSKDDDPTRVSLEGSEPMRVGFSRRRYLEGGESASLEFGDAHGTHLLGFELGDGRLSVLSDPWFMQNRSIGQLDHAAFLWRLTHPGGAGEVWLIRGERRASFWGPLARRTWPGLVSAAVLLAVIAWTVSRRFGPLLLAPPPGRRRLLDHIIASGEFYWRHGAGDILIQAVRDSVQRSLEFRHPGWLASGQLAERLSHLSSLPAEQVAAAFSLDVAHRPEDFTRAVRTLETIRRRL